MPDTTRRPKFEFADGLRAVAALSVAVFHATAFTGHTGDVDESLPTLARIVEIGDYAVPVFIVLSGYVLMLPVARTEGFTLRGGVWKYIGRRARRILPPYYASLALFLLLIALIPVLQTPHDTAWDNKIPVTAGGLVSHLLLVHNWNPGWIYQINGPAWSVATEWHIYFLMPLVLLPLCRLLNPWLMLVVALAMGPAITYLFPSAGSGNYWFIGLFALGMIAALLTVRGTRDVRWLGWASAGVFAVAVLWTILDAPDGRPAEIVSETLVGAAVAMGLVAMGRATIVEKRSVGRRVFEWRPLVNVGLWSYSIYLIHSPLLGLANLLLLPLGLPTLVHWLVMVFLVLPLVLAACHVFFLLVERRFTTSHQQREFARDSGAGGQGARSGLTRRG